jgi:hypothetical protein
MFLDCPAYLDVEGAVRCGLPAEVRCWFTMHASDGPLESAMIRCPAGHWFDGPVEFLTRASRQKHDRGTAGAGSRARRDRLMGAHDGRDGRGGFAAQAIPAEPQRDIRRPNSAPAYYLGRPARLWITAMSPRRRRAPPTQLMQALIGG